LSQLVGRASVFDRPAFRERVAGADCHKTGRRARVNDDKQLP
jgi:hypothetical protein